MMGHTPYEVAIIADLQPRIRLANSAATVKIKLMPTPKTTNIAREPMLPYLPSRVGPYITIDITPNANEIN